MDNKYVFYLKWVYAQLNGSINSIVPCKKCIFVEGNHYTTSKSTLLGGYATVDEIGIYYETLQKNIFDQDYSEEEKKAICIHLILHELSHLVQDYTTDISSEYNEIANDINVYHYMKAYDYDIRMKCGKYDLDYVEDLVKARLMEYQSHYNTNDIPKYRYVQAQSNRVQTYLESHIHSAIPDCVKNFQIRYYTSEKKCYTTWVIKDGIRMADRVIANAINFIVHNKMKDCRTDSYQRLHMNQDILYFDIFQNFPSHSLVQKHSQHTIDVQESHV